MIKALRTVGRYIILMGRVFARPERMRMFFRQYINEIEQLGVNSIGIVLLISFFIGAVITIQIKLNIESPFMPRWTVGYVTREIMLLEFSSSIMCLILAGKVGSNIASELGTMRVTQQIDALEIMGVNSANYLILPKIAAMVSTIPLMVTFSIFAGIIGAFCTCWFGGIMSAVDLEYGLQYMFVEWFIWCGIIKSLFFAFIIASVSAFFGYSVEGGSIEVGKASPSEVAEAQARVAQDEMTSVQADNTYKLSLLDLSQLLELPTPEGFILENPKEELEFEALTPPDDIYTQALAYKPSIKAAEYRLQGSQKNIRIAQSNFYPQLSFSAGLGSNYYTVSGKSEGSFSSQMKNNLNKYIGFNLSVPIFNRFATRNRVRTARLQQANLSLQLDNTKKILYKEIQQAWYNALAAESKYNSSEVAVKANEESFRLMSEKFNNGKATFVEYNEAKLNLTKALSDHQEYLFYRQSSLP